MTIIKIHYDRRTPQVAEEEEVVSGQRQTIAVQFTFSPEWSEFTEKTAVFTSVAAKKSYMLDEDGKVDIPEEVIINGVREFSVSVFGVREGENGEIPRYNGKPTKFSVTRGGDLPGNDTTSDGKPTAYDQLLYKFEVVNSKVGDKLDKFQGEDNEGRALVIGRDGIVRPGDYSGGGVDKEHLQEAVNDALKAAKDSGEFDGKSIKIDEIRESTEDGGNTKVFFSDGTVLNVHNGKSGKPGKSAYLYAKEAGYTGTEEEFAEKLANGSTDAPVKSVNGKTGAVELGAEDVGAPTTEQFEKLSEEFENLPKADWVAKKVWQGDAAAICDKTVFFSGNKEEFYPEIFDINTGIEYTVLWDGVPYVLYATSYEYQPYLGNGSLVYDGAPDTGEPFCFSGIEYSSYCTKVTKSTSDEEEIAFKIAYGDYVGFDKMPEEYLPDGVVKKVNGVSPDKYGNVTVSGGVNFETDSTLELKNGILSVKTAKSVEENNNLPVTSAAVHTTVGNIEVLMKAI